MPYFFISAGFLSLAAWAWVGGHYRDVEGPKVTMLMQEQKYDEIEMREEGALFYQ